MAALKPGQPPSAASVVAWDENTLAGFHVRLREESQYRSVTNKSRPNDSLSAVLLSYPIPPFPSVQPVALQVFPIMVTIAPAYICGLVLYAGFVSCLFLLSLLSFFLLFSFLLSLSFSLSQQRLSFSSFLLSPLPTLPN